MTQTLETLKNEFPGLGEILSRVDQIEINLKDELKEKDREIRKLNKKIEELEGEVSDKEEKIEELEGEVSDKEEKIEELEGEVKDTNHVPARLLQNDLDTIGKMELFAEYFEKYNWFELKERLEK